MKISFTPAINITKAQAFSGKQEVTKPTPETIKDIPNNSMQALLGRSQVVSFSGAEPTKANVVKHTYSKRIGFKEQLEQVSYNKENGNFVHVVTDKSGNLMSMEEYFPHKMTEIKTSVSDDGRKTVKTTTPQSTTLEEFDEAKRPILVDKTTITGMRQIDSIEYDRQRIVTRTFKQGIEQPIQVFDIENHQPVTSGDRVIDTFYNEEKDIHETKNILTGKVLKRERFDKNGNLILAIEYNQKTGQKTSKFVYDKENKLFVTQLYSGERNNRLLEEEFESKDKRTFQRITYKKDGVSVASNVLNRYNRDGGLESETIFDNETNLIATKQIFYDDGAIGKATYRENPNTMETMLIFDENDELITETDYDTDGRTKVSQRDFLDDGRVAWTKYKDGIRFTKAIYNSDEILEKETFYNLKTQKPEFVRILRDKNGNICEYTLDKSGKRKLDETIRDQNQNKLIYSRFREDGRTPIVRQFFKKDGSYKEKTYDEYGNVSGVQEYKANGYPLKNN